MKWRWIFYPCEFGYRYFFIYFIYLYVGVEGVTEMTGNIGGMSLSGLTGIRSRMWKIWRLNDRNGMKLKRNGGGSGLTERSKSFKQVSIGKLGLIENDILGDINSAWRRHTFIPFMRGRITQEKAFSRSKVYLVIVVGST